MIKTFLKNCTINTCVTLEGMGEGETPFVAIPIFALSNVLDGLLLDFENSIPCSLNGDGTNNGKYIAVLIEDLAVALGCEPSEIMEGLK